MSSDYALSGDDISRSLTKYIDAFDPGDFVPSDRYRLIAREVIPRLLGSLEAEGISAFVTHDLNCVTKIYKRSQGRMRLVKASDPRFHPQASSADASVLALVRDAEFVGCVCSRLIWCEQSLTEEMESGRFWVSNPGTMWFPEDRCITNSITARSLSSCHVIYCGSVYLDPTVRGGSVLAAMIRLHFLWVVSHWQWTWLVGLVEDDMLRHYAFDVYGVSSVEQGVWRTREGDCDLHHYHLALLPRVSAMDAWFRPEMADLKRPMGRPPKAVLPQEAALEGRPHRKSEAA